MLNRVRRLKISLAAKCQLLFGSAVVMIIAAALFVPWQRMEQLTEDANKNAAAALADGVVRQHIAAPSTRPIAGKWIKVNGVESPPPRLVGMTPTPGESLSWSEKQARNRLTADPDLPDVSGRYRRPDRSPGFYYARGLPATQDCVHCHTVPTTVQTDRPTLLGFVSVDIPSEINTGQVLLNRVVLLLAGLLAGTLAIVVFYLITTRLILQPVRVLQETAEKVAEGNLNIRSDITTGDEFQQLSETFNVMLANLNTNAEQLRSINKSLDLRVGQLAESNVALYESNRLKSEFLANVSHELRTPLNSILGFAELLKDVTAADARSGRYVQNILSSGKNLLELINDLLDLAKIEAGKMEVRSEPLSLNDVFEALTSVLKPVTEPKALSLQSTVEADVPIVYTDGPKLQQVLYNFLSNAIKFSPPDGAIFMAAAMEPDGQIRVSVTDQGPGIEPAQQAMIFEKFRQLDGSVTRQYSGTGLGLAISKELTALLGGKIGVRSEPGKGAAFWITLPPKIQPGVHDLRQHVTMG